MARTSMTGGSAAAVTALLVLGAGAVAADPAASLPPSQTMDDAGAARLTVTPPADWIAMAAGDAWVAVGDAVRQLDGATGKELALVGVPGETCLAMDVGFDAVWVGACKQGASSIVRIDPATATATATIAITAGDLQFESSVAAGEGAVWAVTLPPAQQLVRIDPATNAVTNTWPIAAKGLLGGVRAGFGGVWVADPDAGAVLHLDPATGEVVATIPTGIRPRFLAVGEGAVWAMNEGDGSVSRIDPATDTVVATIVASGAPVEGGDIAVGGGAVWARVSDQLVSRIDPATNQVTARYGPPSGSGSVAADDAAAWVSAHDVLAVWRLPLG